MSLGEPFAKAKTIEEVQIALNKAKAELEGAERDERPGSEIRVRIVSNHPSVPGYRVVGFSPLPFQIKEQLRMVLIQGHTVSLFLILPEFAQPIAALPAKAVAG